MYIYIYTYLLYIHTVYIIYMLSYIIVCTILSIISIIYSIYIVYNYIILYMYILYYICIYYIIYVYNILYVYIIYVYIILVYVYNILYMYTLYVYMYTLYYICMYQSICILYYIHICLCIYYIIYVYIIYNICILFSNFCSSKWSQPSQPKWSLLQDGTGGDHLPRSMRSSEPRCVPAWPLPSGGALMRRCTALDPWSVTPFLGGSGDIHHSSPEISEIFTWWPWAC